MHSVGDAERQIRQLEGSIGHQKTVAAALVRNGYRGAAAEVLMRVGRLQSRLDARRRDTGTQKPFHAE